MLEAEKSIRIKSLVKQSDTKIIDAASAMVPIESSENVFTPIMEELLSILNSDDLLNEFDDAADKNIIFYVAGYIASSELRCTDCRDICVAQNDEPELNFYPLNTTDQQASSRASLLEQVNKGGLCTPSQTLYFDSVQLELLSSFDSARFSHKRNLCLSQLKGSLR